ncbi:hypothetical protein [Sphingomonas corticis]|uniref:Uncharacterized protein n=1 Tax=Sphingomonas corticis TaxID=2722791 RepID=A0ABX1CUH6_9SPHN|nr:hypothetical protein [Sphingomonas corticis]NJR80062.1 hypothetical protein [Sphingomonas corticis]
MSAVWPLLGGVRPLREDVEDEIAEFVSRAQEERERLYRSVLRRHPLYASPLLLAILDAEGLAVAQVLDVMTPPPDWPDGLALPPRGWKRSRHLLRTLASGDTAANRSLMRRLGHGGVAIRAPAQGVGVFDAWVEGDALAGAYGLGESELVVIGGEARLRLPEGVPEIELVAAVGRMLDHVVDHPLLAGRGYRVHRVVEMRKGSAAALAFRCGLVRIEPADERRRSQSALPSPRDEE